MKLLKTFTDQLEALGEIRKVWLTSFVIDIEFIETYLLPAILKMDSPKTRMDYEAMQQELSSQGIDVQVFCDKRFIEPEQNKRTAIPVHGVSPERLPANGDVRFSETSLFHPKVIYVQGDKGAILGSGSANLTMSGWGRNREVFHFVPVENDPLADSVAAFFKPVFENVQQRFDWDLDVTGKKGDQQDVVFCNSLVGSLFLTQLFGNHKSEELAVWSPYFSGDLAGLVKSLQAFIKNHSMSVKVVPDRVENEYLRTCWNDGLKELHEAGFLSLHSSPFKADDRLNMTHAKLWKTPSALAIGSWNFTQPGANLPTDVGGKTFNVEAGFIVPDTVPVSVYLGMQLEFGPEMFATPDQLKQESLSVPAALPFDLRVVFDWQAERYVVSGAWVKKGAMADSYLLKLPGVDAPEQLLWDSDSGSLQTLRPRVPETKHLLANHRYEVLFDGVTAGAGLIIEQRADYRRAQQYDDLRGLFDDLIISAGAPSSDDVNYRVRETEDGEVLVDSLSTEEDSFSDGRQTEVPDISYFRLFSACHHYVEIVENCSTLKELEHWAFTRPGCLRELVEKTKVRISSMPEGLFNWFLAQEVNELCASAKKRLGQFGGTDNEAVMRRCDELSVAVPKLPRNLAKDYRQWLNREYKRMKRNRGAV
ncbi:PLD-like domain-containing protein [Marinobacter sp. LV10R510-11A]|uniref:phospholipase D-like domain-containing protein n=1 Tax=Marinobacter sp. LV10R510-11A TaxID=1415568 RepID=UPI000BB91BC2|nr:phospholipase D-like domain-containing protein [Marinobacter sp. LV10R510-11A]SOB75603.1 PLD-like domain-containing protein [Marinobacter sp. LV10R510-11A]